ncbi:MAG TPA: type I polyketide synthase, partial [Actinophytocola sp.]|nr:type I polyketide synthase [Actinophytocola sp.]
EADVVDRIAAWDGRLSVAAINGPSSVVVSGDPDSLTEMMAAWEAAGVRASRIDVDYASHSVHVDELREEILAALEPIRPRPSDIPLWSTLTGELLDTAGMDAGYWFRNLREPVRFHPVVQELIGHGHTTFVESSPHPVLVPAIEVTAEAAGHQLGGIVALGTLRRDQPEVRQFALASGEASVRGVAVDWAALCPTGGQPAELPTYAFQRRRFWLEPAEVEPEASGRYRVGWTSIAAPEGLLSGTWLVIKSEGEQPAWAAECVAALSHSGAQVRELAVGADAERSTVAAALSAAVPAALSGGAEVSGVVSLVAALPGGVPGGLGATIAVVQALGDAGIDAPLWVLTSGAVQTGAADDADIDAWHTAVWGTGVVAALEHPRRWGGLVDVPATLTGRGRRCLIGVLANRGAEDQLAVRRTGLYARRLHDHAVRPEAPDWRLSGGTVLITGGTGALGGHVARWVAGRGAEHVVLASRRGPDAPGADALAAELRDLGVEVTVLACDLTDHDAVDELVEAADRHRPLRMVVHTAGVGSLATLDALTLDACVDTLAGKALGAWHLDKALADRDLDAYILFSSIAAVWGSGEHAAYAAANAYVDGLAAARRARGLAATCIAWGTWAGPGMIEGADTDQLARRGVVLMPPDRAVDALADALSARDDSVVLADIDWDRFVPTFTSTRPSPLLSGVARARAVLAREQTVRPAEPSDLGGRLAGLSAVEAEHLVLELVRGLAAAVLGFADAGELAQDTAFREVGFDSLTAVDLRNRLTAATGARLPSTVVFDYPTPRSLARFVLEQVGGGP